MCCSLSSTNLISFLCFTDLISSLCCTHLFSCDPPRILPITVGDSQYSMYAFTFAVCCSVLQCVAVCCSVVQCVAVCCSALQCVVVCCSVLQCVAACCSVLQCVAVWCSVLQCVAMCNTRHKILYLLRLRAIQLTTPRSPLDWSKLHAHNILLIAVGCALN